MNFALYFLLALTAALSVRECLGAAQVSPDSGSTIAGFEGTLDAATLTCNITVGNQISTTWSVGNFRGVAGTQTIGVNFATELFSIGGDPDPNNPGLTYLNQLTILNLTSELDGVMVFCGTGATLEQALFLLRVYRPPNLMDDFIVRILDGRRNIPVDLALDPPAFPEPDMFSWTKDGESLTTGPALTYSTVTFDTVERQDAGNYTVFTTNFILESPTQQIGNDTGSFYLDVIYGPIFAVEGPRQRYVLLNDSLSLLCGTGLDSNPRANVTWMAPDGTTIMDNARYDLENGPEIVRLNFTRTILSDNGIWKCRVFTESDQYILSSGRLVRQDKDLTDELTVDIQLAIIAPPGQPRTLSVDNVEATSFRVCWEAPFTADSPISYYLITASNLNDTVEVLTRNTTTNSTFFNVTGLLPGTTYELTVVAVSQGGNIVARSEPSESMVRTTGFTVPALMCDNPEFSEGGITARWSYIHMGGQTLTNVLVSYTFEESASVSDPISVPFDDVSLTSVNVPWLVAGFRYTFNITAENDIGSSYVLCEPTLLSIGKPFRPSFGELTLGPSSTDVMIQIKTVASGIDDPAQGFSFNIIPVVNGNPEPEQIFMHNDYQSGTFVTLTVRDLTEGLTYSFSATAESFYGESDIANSPTITVGGVVNPSVPPVPPQAGSSIGALIGGVVGVLFVIITIAAISVIVLVPLLYRRVTGKGVIGGEAEVVYEDPDNIQQYIPKNDQDIKLKECLAYETPIKQPDIELEECPAYVEKNKEISNIELEECPAYVEKKKDLSDIELEECPAYVESKRTAS